jgi:hypothetical protein
VERLLAAQGTTAEETVRLEHRRQATMNVTVRNVITSMRLISWFDWAKFVESVSLVDEVLRKGSSFADMDFATRDRYRHAVEELARGSGLPEMEVAARAVAMSDTAPPAEDAERSAEVRRRDPGYYLISSGRSLFGRRCPDASGEPICVPAGAATSGRSDWSPLSPLPYLCSWAAMEPPPAPSFSSPSSRFSRPPTSPLPS